MAEKRKRNKHGTTDRRGETRGETDQDIDLSSEVIQMFRSFQQELDNKHDKYERILKLSRDITIESKRIIFTLHRVKDSESSADLLKQTEDRLTELENTKFRQIAKELVNTDPYQFLKAYTSGLQEYIEAVTFHFYLKDSVLVPHQLVQDRLVFKTTASENKPGTTQTQADTSEDSGSLPEVSSDDVISVLVPPSEYILGIADLTGEMMRRAINSVGDGDLNRPFEICAFLQQIESAYSGLNNSNRDVNRKLSVLRQSLRKVEAACYTLRVRGSEIPKHMLVDMISKNNSAAQFIDEPVVDED